MNLLRNSDFANGLSYFGTGRGSQEISSIDGLKVIKFTANNQEGEHYLFQTLGALPPWFKGELTASMYVRTEESLLIDLFLQENNNGYLSNKITEKEVNGWEYFVVTATVTGNNNNNIRFALRYKVMGPDMDGKIMYIYHPKVEIGTIDTDWSLSPKDLLLKGEADGRNLFVMGDSEVGYIDVGKPDGVNRGAVNGERTSEFIPVSEGDVFTLQSWATAFDVTYAPYMIDYCWYSEKDGSKNIGDSIRHIGGVSSAFNHAAITTNPAPNEAKYMRVDARLYSDGKIKVERGSVATDWTPAPEDVVVKSELDALIKRIATLEAQAGITSADSFMESPSMDIMESGSETASADDTTDDMEIN